MSFAHPMALLGILLAIPIVWLYLRPSKSRQECVTTGLIWQQVFDEDRLRKAWRPWRHRASLAVQLLILTLFVLAAAEPMSFSETKEAQAVDETATSLPQKIVQQPALSPSVTPNMGEIETGDPRNRPESPLGLSLAICGLTLLIAEWCLYQRRWIV